MKKKSKGFPLLEVLFALLLVSLCVVVYYPQLKNALVLQKKANTERIVLHDLDNAIESLKSSDDVDKSILSENSTVNVKKTNHNGLIEVDVSVTNGDVTRNVSFYKQK